MSASEFEFETDSFFVKDAVEGEEDSITKRTLYVVRGEDAVEVMRHNPSLVDAESQKFERFLEEDDQEAVYQFDELISALNAMREKVESDYVKVRVSDDRPVMFFSKDNDTRIGAAIAPVLGGSMERLNPIEANLLGYHVVCQESDCEWKGSRYLGKVDAEEAALDHRYFTGHQFRIFDFQGNEVDTSEL
jgi:hypothetical protein